MGKQDESFFDGLMEDFAAAMDTKAAIEASRDANGKIDVAKATGLAMGLGHTSDNDLAIMAGVLGAEGAFDSDDTRTFKPDYACSSPGTDPTALFVAPVPTDPAAVRASTPTAKKYLARKALILRDNRTDKRFCLGALCLVTLIFLFLIGTQEEAGGVLFAMMLVIVALIGAGVHHTNKTTQKELTDLNAEYRPLLEREEAERAEKAKAEEEKKKQAAAGQTVKTPTCRVDVKQVEMAVNLVRMQMKRLLDEADELIWNLEPTYSEDKLAALLCSLFYFTVKDREEPADVKAKIFDRLVYRSGLKTDFTGRSLFIDNPGSETDDRLQDLADSSFRMMTDAVYRIGEPDEGLSFTMSLFSLMLTLGGIVEQDLSVKGLGMEGAQLVLRLSEETGLTVNEEDE